MPTPVPWGEGWGGAGSGMGVVVWDLPSPELGTWFLRSQAQLGRACAWDAQVWGGWVGGLFLL